MRHGVVCIHKCVVDFTQNGIVNMPFVDIENMEIKSYGLKCARRKWLNEILLGIINWGNHFNRIKSAHTARAMPIEFRCVQNGLTEQINWEYTKKCESNRNDEAFLLLWWLDDDDVVCVKCMRVMHIVYSLLWFESKCSIKEAIIR